MGFLEFPYTKGRIKKTVSANSILVTSKGIDIYINNANAYNYRPNQSVVLSSFNGEYRILDKPMILEKPVKAPDDDTFYFTFEEMLLSVKGTSERVLISWPDPEGD